MTNLVLAVDLDCVVAGLTRYVEDAYGIRDIIVTSTPTAWSSKLQFDWTSRIGSQTYTQQWYKEIPDPRRPGYAHRDIANCFLRALEKAAKPTFKVFVEVLIGKYKGSIGFLTFRGIELGIDIVSGSGVTVSMLSTKNLRFAPEATHTRLVYEKVKLTTQDTFGNTNDIGDIIVYVDNGKLNFGIYIEDDVVEKRIVLKTMIGKKIRREYLKLTRDMMNITKMPSGKLATQIFKAQLTAD